MPQTAAKIEFLEKTAREMPEYEEILAFFSKLLTFLQGRERETGISFRVSRENRKEKVAGGLPLISPEDMSVCGKESALFLLLLIDLLKEAGKGGDEQLTGLALAISEARLDLTALFRACLGRDRQAVEAAAAAIEVPAPLLEFLLETALKPALELVAEQVAPTEVEGWQENYCPVCGSRAGMAELSGEEGRRASELLGLLFFLALQTACLSLLRQRRPGIALLLQSR